MANTSFQLFKPTTNQSEEIYLGQGALGLDNMTEGYPLNWTTRLENKGRLYRKSEFTFRTSGYMRSSDIVKIATIKQKGQPIFSEPSINSTLRSGNILSSNISPILKECVISLTGSTPLTEDFVLDITNLTNAQWLEISIDYDGTDTYTVGSTVLTLADLGDDAETIYDGGNRSAFLNRIRESLYYEFSLLGILKMGGYQSDDTTSTLRFKMYYPFDDNAPASDFTDFMGIGTETDFLHYISSEINNGNNSVSNATTYTQIKIGELSSTNLKLVGSNAPDDENYQLYYMDAKTYGETNIFNCRISFNSNPTYTEEGTNNIVHYFNSFASSTSGDYYLDDDTAFIFHINIKPRGFARRWRANETDYNNYYQWNYTPYDIKVVIMVAEPIPYLEFNNSSLVEDDFVLLEAKNNSVGTLSVNSNMLWNIESLQGTENYDVAYSEIELTEPLYIESND